MGYVFAYPIFWCILIVLDKLTGVMIMLYNSDNEPQDGMGSGFGGASNRQQAKYREELQRMYEKQAEERKYQELNRKLDKLLENQNKK